MIKLLDAQYANGFLVHLPSGTCCFGWQSCKILLNVPLNDLEITAVHDLPKWKNGTQPVIVQLLSPDKKNALMRKHAMLRGSKVYVNDHLSQTNSDLFREARRLKKDNNVFSAWIMNCKIFIKKSEHAPRLHFDKVQQLRNIVR